MQKFTHRICTVTLMIFACCMFNHAQVKKDLPLLAPPSVDELALQAQRRKAIQTLVDKAVGATIQKFSDKRLKPENIAITLVDLSTPYLVLASFNGEQKIYPASVVKLFYLAAVHRWLEDRKLKDTPELQRAMKDMIVESSNDATQFIVDTLTGVSGGPELSEKGLKIWAYKRNAINRYFESLGFTNINVCQKTYCEDAYGREQQFRGKDGANRNKLTTVATAALLTRIVQGNMITPDRSKQMMELLKRDYEMPRKNNEEDQDYDFTAMALKPGMKLWSKAGWTSTTRHDAAYVETPDGKKFVLVVFTTGVAREKNIIPDIARTILAEMK